QPATRQPPSAPAPSSARGRITALFMAGVVLIVAGASVAAVAHPYTTVQHFGAIGALATDHGSQPGWVTGLVLAAVGAALVQVGIIAAGVWLGLRASRE
ncbi:MAG: hypothetical protein ACRDP1_10500, partial [Nocardioidaceae bacterium]